MRTLIYSSAGLLALSGLVACDTPVDADSTLSEYSPLGEPLNDPDGEADEIEVPDGAVPIINAVYLPYVRWAGESGGDRAGIAVQAVGDVNGDGRDDVLIGSIFAADTQSGGTNSGDGAAYVERSPFRLTNSNLSGALLRYYGPTGSKAGQSLGGGGDATGDGANDYVIGALTEGSVATSAGAAYLIESYNRRRNDLETASGVIKLTGEGAYDRAGAAVDLAGDVNGDGVGDLIVTATELDTAAANAGGAYIVYGPVVAGSLTDADVILTGVTAQDKLGTRSVGAGDIDGDGADDVLVSARFLSDNGAESGGVYVVTNPAAGTSSISTATALITGGQGGDQAGNDISAAGDMNNDGYADFLVGALKAGGTGRAYLFLGPVAGNLITPNADTVFSGQVQNDQFGSAVTVGDADEDGTTDVFVSANRRATSDRGAVYVFANPGSGNIAGGDRDIIITGAGPDADYFGSSVAVINDIEFDGTDALVVGASNRGNSNKPSKGVVYSFEFPLF